MPATAPGLVSVPLLSGQTAMVSLCDAHPLQRVQVEIPMPIGVFREAAWKPGSARSRKQLINDALVSEADAMTIETAAIQFLNDTCTSRAGGTATFSPIQVDGFARGSTERKMFMVNDFVEFTHLLGQPVGPDYYLEWKGGLKNIANMDADWHDKKKGIPSDDIIDDLMFSLKPTPALVHRTPHGFHAIYAPFGKFTADELGAAGMAAHLDNPMVSAYGGTCELLTRTRHPLSMHNGQMYGRIRLLKQDDMMPALSCFSRVSCDEDEAKEVAEHLGLQVGQRYAHNRCPFRPEHRSNSPNPVVIHADGVHCFSCGRTWSWGTLRRKAGLPMRTTAETQIITDAIANWVPHAQVARYFEALAPWLGCNLPEGVRANLFRTLHRALVKRHFKDDLPAGFDLRLNSLFNKFPWVRSVNGLWLRQDCLQIVNPKPDRSDMALCPAAQQVFVTKDGVEALEPDQLEATKLAKNGNLQGWMPIVGIPVTPVWHVNNDPPASASILRCRAKPIYQDPMQYIADPAARMPLEQCLTVIDRRFPGINFGYLALLHIARGLGEQGSCQLPIIWATGQTGTAKTSHAYVECAMHDEVPENLAGQDESKIRDCLGEAQTRTGTVMLDDFAKAADSAKTVHKLEEVMQFTLQYNRALTFHKRHVAMLSIPVTTTLLLTEMKQPRSFLSNKQLGRRVAMVVLETACPSWSTNEEGQQRSGFKDWWRETPELRKAAESWHSWIIDAHLPSGASTEWKHHVEGCGFQMLADYADNDEVAGARSKLIKTFTQALLAAPMCKDDNASIEAHVFKGAKEIIRGESSHLSVAAQDLIEFSEFEEMTADTIRLALEPYQGMLHTMMPLGMPCSIQVGRKGARIFVRLREQGKRNHAVAKINEACLFDGGTPTSRATVQNLLDPSWNNP